MLNKHCTAADFWFSQDVVSSLLWPLLSQELFVTELLPINGQFFSLCIADVISMIPYPLLL